MAKKKAAKKAAKKKIAENKKAEKKSSKPRSEAKKKAAKGKAPARPKAKKKAAKARVAKNQHPAPDLATAAYLRYCDRVAKGDPGDELGDWLAAEQDQTS